MAKRKTSPDAVQLVFAEELENSLHPVPKRRKRQEEDARAMGALVHRAAKLRTMREASSWKSCRSLRHSSCAAFRTLRRRNGR